MKLLRSNRLMGVDNGWPAPPDEDIWPSASAISPAISPAVSPAVSPVVSKHEGVTADLLSVVTSTKNDTSSVTAAPSLAPTNSRDRIRTTQSFSPSAYLTPLSNISITTSATNLINLTNITNLSNQTNETNPISPISPTSPSQRMATVTVQCKGPQPPALPDPAACMETWCLFNLTEVRIASEWVGE